MLCNEYMDLYINTPISCRFCKHFNPVGQRGGDCEKLQAYVSSNWDACSLAEHPFAPSREYEFNLAGISRPDAITLIARKEELTEIVFVQKRKARLRSPMRQSIRQYGSKLKEYQIRLKSFHLARSANLTSVV